MSDVEDFLQEGFDPRAVTMPRLRSILVSQNVDYPATAKKAQLVALVEEKVLPLAPKLRAQRAKAKRSSMGFINAGSAEDTGNWAEHDLAPPPTASRRSKSPRKSSARVKTEDYTDTSTMRSTSKRSSRSVSRALSNRDEDEFPETAKSRRNRRTVTPQIKYESEEDDHLGVPEEENEEEGEDSVFTDDNPFQSGSSPPITKTPTNRRRTGDSDVIRSAKSSRRQTGDYDDDVKLEKTSQLRVPKVRRPKSPGFEVEAGEEFTPDEQLELEEAASKGEVSLAPRKPSRQTSLTTPILVLFLTLIGAYATWYRQEKIAVGFCGLGRPAKQIIPAEVPVPDVLVPFIEPQCEQCPPHAYCYTDLEVRCEPDFVLQQHPLSLAGLVPLPPSCEPDSEKARRVQAVADKAVEELRERRAKFECGELVDENGKTPDSPAIPEEELKETVSRKRSKRLNSDEFEALWDAAIGEVTARDEVEIEPTKAPDSGRLQNHRLSTTSLARISLTCAIKRSVRLGLARNRFSIGLLMSLIFAGFYVRARYRRHITTSAQIPALVDSVLGRLSNQKELGEEDLDDPWLFLPNLRDDVLRSVHSLSERDRIWQRVRAVVEQNSNVRTSQREGRSGEVGRAWEWIGPTAGEGARRRRSGRVSWAPELKSDIKSESPEPARDVPEIKKWDEPRPIY